MDSSDSDQLSLDGQTQSDKNEIDLDEELQIDEKPIRRQISILKGKNASKMDSESEDSDLELQKEDEKSIDNPFVLLGIPEDKKLEIRPVQMELYEKAMKEKNAIIFLETGQGKTLISVMVMRRHLIEFPNKKIAFIANTLNLVEQQSQAIAKYLEQVHNTMKKEGEELDISVREDIKEHHSGKTTPFPKPDEFKILVITAQTMLNGLRRSKIKLEQFSLLVFDECHHCQSNHAYNLIFYEFYHRQKENKPHILGLTAAPGDKVEVSTKAAQNIMKQINSLETNMDSKIIVSDIDNNNNKVDIILDYGNDPKSTSSTEDLLELCKNANFYTYFDSLRVNDTFNYINKFQEIVKQKHSIKIDNLHLKKLLLSIEKLIFEQSIILYIEVGALALHDYIQDFYQRIVIPVAKTIDSHLKDEEKKYFEGIKQYLKLLIEKAKINYNKYSEKFQKLCNVIRQNLEADSTQNIIIFVEMRYVAKMIAHYLKTFGIEIKLQINADYITGKVGRRAPLVEEARDDERVSKHEELFIDKDSKNDHFSKITQQEFQDNQKINELIREDGDIMNILEQMQRVRQFREKSLNVLVCTSVTEEGFDIPECGLVISYDPPRSPLSYIQIKGRARREDSTYLIFVHTTKQQKWTQEIDLFKVYLGVMKGMVKSGKVGERKKPPKGISIKYLQIKDDDFLGKTVENIYLNTNWAVELLLMYCSYFSARPMYRYYQLIGLGYFYTVALPPEISKKIGVVKGGFSRVKENAKRQAAFKCCEQLFEKNLITKRLRPLPLYFCGLEKYSLERDMIMRYPDDPIISEKFQRIYTIKKKNTFGLYPITDYDPFKGKYQMKDQEIIAYLYSASCMELPDLLKFPRIGRNSLGILYFDDSLDNTTLRAKADEGDPQTEITMQLKLVDKIIMDRTRYQSIVDFMKYCECTIRSYDQQYFGYYLKKQRGEPISVHFKEFHNFLSFLPDLKENNPYLACFVPLSQKNTLDTEIIDKTLIHIGKLEKRYQETTNKLIKSENSDKEFLEEFRSNPGDFQIIQSWQTFRKFIVLNYERSNEASLIDKKIKGTTLLFENIFLDKADDNEGYILSLTSLGKGCERMLLRKDVMTEKNQSTDYDINFTSFPLHLDFIMELHYLKVCQNQLRTQLHLKQFKSNVLGTIISRNKGEQILTWQPQFLNSYLACDQTDELIGTSIDSKIFEMMQNKICDWTPSDPIQYEDKLNVIDLKSITDSLDLKEVLTALSSKKYNSKENYDRLEFLGDTILKLLSTIEVFASKISANEFELHHERARILNNYNLYRLAIKYDIYLYVLGKKPEDLPITFAKKALEEEDVNQCLKEDVNFSVDNYANEMSSLETKFSGYQGLSYKVFADVVEALTGVYFKAGGLEGAQQFLYSLDVLSFSSFKYNIIKPQMMENSEIKSLEVLKKYVESSIGNVYHFKNPFYLLQACTHETFQTRIRESMKLLIVPDEKADGEESQYKNEKEADEQKKRDSLWNDILPNITYERLEFLGDAILDYYTVQFIYNKFPERDSGVLTGLKSNLVNNALLSLISVKSGLSQALLSQKAEFNKYTCIVTLKLSEYQSNIELYESEVNEAGFDDYIKIAADVVEAFIGAVYLDSDQNLTLTLAVIHALVHEIFDKLADENKLRTNPQFLFKQHCKKNGWPEPEIKQTMKDKDQEKPGKVSYQLWVKDKMYAKYDPPPATKQYDIEKRLYKTALAFVNDI